MTDRPFIDTNVLVYLLGEDVRKADLAQAALARGGVVSVQVLNEFTSVARRKAGLSWDEVDDALATFKQLLDVRPLDIETHESGMRIAARYGFSVYDALIVSAALQAGCTNLLSEDMQNNQRVEGLTIVDPFA